jgi:hypothetical protein
MFIYTSLCAVRTMWGKRPYLAFGSAKVQRSDPIKISPKGTWDFRVFSLRIRKNKARCAYSLIRLQLPFSAPR